MYFRARLPGALAAFLGKSHLIGSLGTADPRIAKRRAGRTIWSLAGRLEIMVSRMVELNDIDGLKPSQAERLAVEAFRLGSLRLRLRATPLKVILRGSNNCTRSAPARPRDGHKGPVTGQEKIPCGSDRSTPAWICLRRQGP